MAIEISSTLYMCFHEAGHIETACQFGVTVERAVVEDDADPRSSIRHKDMSTKRPVACGGYSAERILFESDRLIDQQGDPVSLEEFNRQAMVNARLDKRPFYLQCPQDESGMWPHSQFQPNEDWTWPEGSDAPFIAYSEEHVMPILLKRFRIVESLALELCERRELTTHQIETIRNA